MSVALLPERDQEERPGNGPKGTANTLPGDAHGAQTVNKAKRADIMSHGFTKIRELEIAEMAAFA
ncbi:MAG: hypothetical protein KKD85_06260, partial [Proteobacteria bacterium]|nr:hypothetical protein [Pseudomonadota bacterium]